MKSSLWRSLTFVKSAACAIRFYLHEHESPPPFYCDVRSMVRTFSLAFVTAGRLGGRSPSKPKASKIPPPDSSPTPPASSAFWWAIASPTLAGQYATPRKLEELLRMEYRTKLLNPKWANTIAAQGSAGAYQISQRMTALIG
jgi:CobN/Magnesium Chelatase